MNRKLLNGLLVLTVAAGGVGTFTSCKDEDFRSQQIQISSLQAQIDALRDVSDQAFYDKLKDLFDQWVQTVEGPQGPQGPVGPGGGGGAGQAGKDAVVLTLNPPIISLQCNSAGVVDGDLSLYTSVAQVYQGGNVSDGWEYSAVASESDNVTVTVDASTGLIQVASMADAARFGTVTIQATKSGADGPMTLKNVLVVQKNLAGASGGNQDWEDWLAAANNWTSTYSNPYGWTYNDFVKAGVTMMDYFARIKAGDYKDDENDPIYQIVNGLYNMMFENIFPNQAWFQQIFTSEALLNNLLQRASSVGISRTYNPVLGTINLPIGISTTVLATYDYKCDMGSFEFPNQAAAHMAKASPINYAGLTEAEMIDLINVIDGLATQKGVNYIDLPGGVAFTDAQEFGNMGGAVVTINPQSVDFTGAKVSLVNSKNQTILSSENEVSEGVTELSLTPFDEMMYWGVSRADNSGVYALNVNASANNFGKFTVDLDKSELKDALLKAKDDKSISSMASLGDKVFRALNNELPAYAVKVSWMENVPTGKYNADGTPVTEEVENYVLSDFDLAAVVAHPLSYGTEISNFIDPSRRLPKFSPLEEYLDKIGNKLNIKFEKAEYADNVEIEFNLRLDEENGLVWFTYTNAETGEEVVESYPYDADGIQASEESLQSLIDAVLRAAGMELQGDINYTLVKNLNDAVDSINDALEQFEGKVGDFKDYIERAKNSNKLTYADKLIDIYNELAARVNYILDKGIDHYLQIFMAYSAGNGPHHLSNDVKSPTHFSSKKGTGFELYASSHTGDVVVPSYKKWVAITQITTKDGKVTPVTGELFNGGENAQYLNKVLPGHVQRIPVKITNDFTKYKGATLTVTYVSVDYRGTCSMQNYYITID